MCIILATKCINGWIFPVWPRNISNLHPPRLFQLADNPVIFYKTTSPNLLSSNAFTIQIVIQERPLFIVVKELMWIWLQLHLHPWLVMRNNCQTEASEVPKASTRLPVRLSKSTCAMQHSHYVAAASYVATITSSEGIAVSQRWTLVKERTATEVQDNFCLKHHFKEEPSFPPLDP